MQTLMQSKNPRAEVWRRCIYSTVEVGSVGIYTPQMGPPLRSSGGTEWKGSHLLCAFLDVHQVKSGLGRSTCGHEYQVLNITSSSRVYR